MKNNLKLLVEQEIQNGYGDLNARAKVCQDIILKAIAKSSLNRNVTIKGGVVMRGRTGNIRRATKDIDIDFIKYSLTDESIDAFIKILNCLDGISIVRMGRIEILKQQDYHGKRVYIKVMDNYNNLLESKIDLGVHNHFDIEQEEYCFDIALDEEGASLLINSNEQMFSEKLRSLLLFGPVSTRYKDIFDMYYLSKNMDVNKLKKCMHSYIYNDDGMREDSIEEVRKRVKSAFNNRMFVGRLSATDKKWIDEDIETVINDILSFLGNRGLE